MVFIYLAVFIYGAIVGSFLNVVILRPQKHESLLVPSHCPVCGHRIRWYDLIPIVSYVALRGRCRDCKTKISPQYFAVELLNATLWTITFAICGIDWLTVVWCLMISALIVLSVADIKTQEIPPTATAFVLLLGVTALGLSDGAVSHLVGLFAVSVPLYLLYRVTDGSAIGGGDVKLMAALGLCLGWQRALLGLMVGCLMACLVHLPAVASGRRGHAIAFGPYLSAGAIVSAWAGGAIINWYNGLF